MEIKDGNIYVLLPQKDFQELMETVKQILQRLDSMPASKSTSAIMSEYIPAKEFMNAINIKRTKFYELVTTNQIKTIKKNRKVYVLASEIKRYFTDPAIR